MENLKLKQFRGNLTEFVEKNPKAKSFFELKSSTGFVMRFPQPGYIDGVKSKGKPLEDLRKAQVYLGWLIKELENEWKQLAKA